MPTRCCVPDCDNETSGHSCPKDPEVARKWSVAIHRLAPTSKNKLYALKSTDRVCHAHFQPSDYRARGLLGERKRLCPGAVPSIFPFKKPKLASSYAREKRLQTRSLQKARMIHTSLPEAPQVEDNTNDLVLEMVNLDISEEVMVESSEKSIATQCSMCPCSVGTESVSAQCNILSDKPSTSQQETPLTIEKLKDNPKMILYYTGFANYDHFMYLFHLLGPSTTCLSYQCGCVTPVNQLFMTVMKLRQAKDDIELAYLFQVGTTTVGTIIRTWINFLFYELKEIDIWPSKEVIVDTIPRNFRKQFPNTRVILDATEIPIVKPSDVALQSSTFSSYKNRNTAKTLVGISPAGMVTFISDTFGGAATDRQIVERSSLCTEEMFVTGDSIMADRGLMVQDLFANKNVHVNTPRMLKGKSQLDPIEVVLDRRIASKRIHVERVIGLAKTYKILKRELPASKRQLAGRITFICFMLSNLREPIVGAMA